MKKNAPTVGSLRTAAKRQIEEPAKRVSVEESLMGNTSVADMSQQEAALLSISSDLASVLRLLGETKDRVILFETFARSLASQITALRPPRK